MTMYDRARRWEIEAADEVLAAKSALAQAAQEAGGKVSGEPVTRLVSALNELDCARRHVERMALLARRTA